VIIKAITGRPKSMEGISSALAHSSLVENVKSTRTRGAGGGVVVELNWENWNDEVLRSPILTLVYFWHERCPWYQRFSHNLSNNLQLSTLSSS